jgi:hypothetical protein
MEFLKALQFLLILGFVYKMVQRSFVYFRGYSPM